MRRRHLLPPTLRVGPSDGGRGEVNKQTAGVSNQWGQKVFRAEQDERRAGGTGQHSRDRHSFHPAQSEKKSLICSFNEEVGAWEDFGPDSHFSWESRPPSATPRAERDQEGLGGGGGGVGAGRSRLTEAVG